VTVRLIVSLIAALTAIVTPGTAETATAPGVTTKTVRVTVGRRSFSARLSYPSKGGPYPAVAFAHGFMARPPWYAGTLTALARSGYVVIAPSSETGPYPSHARLADDLNRSLAWLAAGKGTPQGVVDPSKTAVAGHSMGGGVALLAASRSRTIDTVATLAAANTSPSAVTAAGKLRVPSLFVVGSDDRIVPAGSTAAIFRRARQPKLLAVVTGGSHCGFMEVVPPACDAGRISYTRQLGISRTQLRRWLDRYLAGKKATRVTGVPGVQYIHR
jgi:dienelactone hydrolase